MTVFYQQGRPPDSRRWLPRKADIQTDARPIQGSVSRASIRAYHASKLILDAATHSRRDFQTVVDANEVIIDEV